MSQSNLNLWHSAFYQFLDANERTELIRQSSTLSRAKGEVVVTNNLFEEKVCYLLKGIMVQGYAGIEKDVITDIVLPDEFCPDFLFKQPSTKSTFLRAADDSVILVISRSTLESVANNNIKLSSIISTTKASYVRRLERLLETSSLSTRGRVASLIKVLGDRIGRPVGDEIYVKGVFTQYFMADVCHSSRQSITKIMSEFKQEGLINYDRKGILIKDIDGLK